MEGSTLRLLMGPDAGELAGGGLGAPAAEPVAPTTPDSPSPTAGLTAEQLGQRPDLYGGGDPTPATTPATTPTAADPNLGAASGQPATGSPGIREASAAWGLDLSGYQDDQAAWAAIVQMAQRGRENSYYDQLGRQIAPHYQGVQEYLRQQQTANAAPAERPGYQAPEFDERILQFVEKDPATGAFVPKGGNPAWAQFATQAQQFADHVDRFSNLLVRDPKAAIGELVRELASEVYEQRSGVQQEQAVAAGIIAQNEAWIYQTDDQNRRLVGRDGRYVPTPMGARYYTLLQELRQAGVRDSRSMDAMAKRMLQGEIASQQPTQAPAVRPQATGALARPNVNPGQAVDPSRRNVVPGTTNPSMEGRSLLEVLREGFKADGVTDADIFGSVGS